MGSALCENRLEERSEILVVILLMNVLHFSQDLYIYILEIM